MRWGKNIIDTPLGVSWPQGNAAVPGEEGHPSISNANPNSSSSSSSSNHAVQPGRSTANPGSSSSWRSSCRTVIAGRAPSSGTVIASDLSPLLGALQRLQVLYLHEVRPEGLQDLAASLKQLRALHFERAEFRRPEPPSNSNNSNAAASKTFLDTVAELTNLRHLGMPYCKIEDPWDGEGTLPTEFTNLVHISSLDFTHTKLTEKGVEVLCSMTSIQHLDLSAVATWTDSISRLVRLETLLLNSAGVEGLPEGMTALTGLRKLEWCYVSADFRPPLEVVWRLPSLQHLAISTGRATSLPDDISHLTALTELWLQGPCLEYLSAGLVALEGLQRLTLFAERLEGLPQGMAALTALTYMATDARPTVLEGLPPGLHVESLVEEEDSEEVEEV